MPFEHTFLLGHTNVKTCRVLIFDQQSMPGMVRLSEDCSSEGALFSGSKASRIFEPRKSSRFVLEPEVFPPPPIFDLVAKDSPILMVSREFAQGFADGMSNEAFLFLGDSQKGLIDLLQSIRHLGCRGIFTIRIQLDGWVGEMKAFENIDQVPSVRGNFAGSSDPGDTGSIAVLNSGKTYMFFLFKSFGVPALFLFLRYLFEAVLIAPSSTLWQLSWVPFSF